MVAVKPRLVAMDCDDTLLTDELTVPVSAVEAIAAARKIGVRVVVATGRMYRSALPYALAAGVDGPVIAYNGGMVKTLDGVLVQHNPVPLPEAQELVEIAEEHDLCLNIYIDDELYFRKWDANAEYYVSIAQTPYHVEPDLRSVLREAPTKVLVVGNTDEAVLWQAKLAERFRGRLAISRSKPRFVEIMKAGVNKGTALGALATSLGIDRSEVMAIGDSYNDLDMLKYVGIGVAVGNAAPDVKAQVDYVTVRNEEGGIAEAIYKFVLND